MHVCHIKRYSDASVETPAQMKEVAEFTDRTWYSVYKIKDVQEAAGHVDVLVAWKGLTTAGDSWKPLTVMFEEVPSKILEFFKSRCLNPILVMLALQSASRPAMGANSLPDTCGLLWRCRTS